MLTKTDVDRLKYDPTGPAQQILWDEDVAGFGVRVYASGLKSFVLSYRTTAGRVRMMTIGPYGSLTVKQARERAQREVIRIRDGCDPVEERRERRGAVTLEAAGLEYIEASEGRLKPKTLNQYRLLLRKHIAKIGKKPVTDVSVPDVRQLHHALRATPVSANHTVNFLSSVLHWAESQGYRPVNSNPCTAVKRYRESKRERYLSVAEVGALSQALQTALTVGLPPAPHHKRKPGSPEKQKHTPKNIQPIKANPFAVACIRFLLLSGWRSSEARTLKWAEVDFARRSATLTDSKTGRSHRPLGAPALALLSELDRVSDYVFPGEKDGEPIKDFKRVWGAVRFAAGLEDVRLHDLRHTMASFAVASGHSLFVTGSLLGHSRPSTTARYAHLHDDARHAAADTVSGIIADAMSKVGAA